MENPHLNALDKIQRPFLIGVAGGTASGKVSLFHIAHAHFQELSFYQEVS